MQRETIQWGLSFLSRLTSLFSTFIFFFLQQNSLCFAVVEALLVIVELSIVAHQIRFKPVICKLQSV